MPDEESATTTTTATTTAATILFRLARCDLFGPWAATFSARRRRLLGRDLAFSDGCSTSTVAGRGAGFGADGGKFAREKRRQHGGVREVAAAGLVEPRELAGVLIEAPLHERVRRLLAGTKATKRSTTSSASVASPTALLTLGAGERGRRTAPGIRLEAEHHEVLLLPP